MSTEPPNEPSDRQNDDWKFGAPFDDEKREEEGTRKSKPKAHKALSKQARRDQMLRDYSRYGSVGVQFGVVLILFILGGYWLDKKFGSSPVLLVLGVVVGFGGGLLSLMHRFPVSKRHRKTPPNSPDDT